MVSACIGPVASVFPPAVRQDELWTDCFADRYTRRGSERLWAASGVRTRHARVDPRFEDARDWSTGARMERYTREAQALSGPAVAAALRAAGADVLVPALEWSWPWPDAWGSGRPRHVRAVNGVHVLASGGELLHTHEPEPLRALLAVLDTPPDLVVADHGWAGAAGQAGIDAVGFADSNDPALFVGEAEGRVTVCVPLDDNVSPELYAPLTGYLLNRADLPG